MTSTSAFVSVTYPPDVLPAKGERVQVLVQEEGVAVTRAAQRNFDIHVELVHGF